MSITVRTSFSQAKKIEVKVKPASWLEYIEY